MPAQRLESFDPVVETEGRGRRAVRRIGLGIAAVLGVGLTVLAARRIGLHDVAESIVRLGRDLAA